MGNALAQAALILWPAIAIATFAARRRRVRLARTTAWMIVVPAMFLPARLAIDLPGLPDLDKHRAAFLAIAVALELFHPIDLRERLRAHKLARLVLVVLAYGAVQTARTNGDTLFFGPTTLPGLTSWDAISMAATWLIDVYVPFAIGERVFRTERDVLDLLDVLARCGLVYAPLALVEVLLSPQLHRWIYGFYQHSFAQHIRDGGYRPMLFMSHGLSVAMFAFTCLQASLTLVRLRVRSSTEPGLLAGASAAMLLMCKSMASIVYGVVASALQLLFSERAKARLVAAVCAVVLAYPVLRMERLVPLQQMVGFFGNLSAERAGSLLFRFDEEEQLLQRAAERPVYGWGPWQRNHLFASWGQRTSITDGTWIVLLGEYGYVGFGGFFLLLVLPMLQFVRVRTRMPHASQVLLGGLALILAVCAVDLLPNSRSDYLSTVYAGALLAVAGRYRGVRSAPLVPHVAAPAAEVPERAAV